MIANFARSLALVLKWEGGYVNDPRDPGGATNRGITQAVYDAWRSEHGLVRLNVRKISEAEVAAIYRHDYWDRLKGDRLPAGLDYAAFDFAVNSGVNRAARFVQACVGIAQDGKIGPVTIAAIKAANVHALIVELCARRQAFLEGLPTFDHFGDGWSRRVRDVLFTAGEMV